MLELKTKWFTNSLAKQSMLNKDFILCHDGTRLFIVGYGEITSSGKNTYNYEVKDNEKNIVLSSGENAYLDALTKIILGTSPKAKANKDSESANKRKNTSSLSDEYERLLKKMQESKEAFENFCTLHDITNLEDAIKKDNEERTKKRSEAQSKRRNEEAKILRINKLRKWAKDTKRLELLQKLNEKILEM